MKITMKNAWVSMTERYSDSTAKLDLDGVGEIEIREPLPQSIKEQIEAFYIGVYHERMARRETPQNPATLTLVKEEL